ncbi:MAG TPA: GDP-mannose 4,6-dehydratase [Chloroflexia bacterium]|nr:GDP-mannose 4,6-dehydratase [Chloroflexia bacterium]
MDQPTLQQDLVSASPARKRVLITGIAGFVGSNLVEYLLDAFPGKLAIFGITANADTPHLAAMQDHPDLTLRRLQLENAAGLNAAVAEIRPDFIFHLAAQSFVGPAISNPGLTLNTNINITLNLFEAVRQAGLAEHTRLLNAGSGDQYGFIQPENLPVREDTPFRPGNPYAVSKIAQEMLGYQYSRSYKMPIFNTRAFNHLGPRQSDQLAAGAFARQIAQAEAGQIEPVIRVGNLQARRDYTDVRDVVRAYWLALQPEIAGHSGCLPGEPYNICSGRAFSMQEILEKLIGLARLPLEVSPDPARMRPSDLPEVVGDNTRFRQATGWQPAIPLEKSLADLLDYWRSAVKAS